MSVRRVLAAAIFLVISVPAMAAPTKLDDFAKFPQYEVARISPTGEYLGVKIHRGDQSGLAFLRLSDLKVVGVVPSDSHDVVANFWWAGPKRVLMSMATDDGSLESPALTGELTAIDVDGSDHAYLIGYRGDGSLMKGRTASTSAYGSARLIAARPEDPKYALVSFYDWSNSEHQHATVLELDKSTGHQREVAVAPDEYLDDFVADRNGFVRFVTGTNLEHVPVTYIRSPEHPEWVLLNKGRNIHPQRISEDLQYAYLLSDEHSQRLCLVRQTLASGELKTLACDEDADITEVFYAWGDKTPMVAVAPAGRFRLHYLESDRPEAALYKSLVAGFPGQFVEPVSSTLDGKLVVLHVYSDRNPGDFYLFDAAKKDARYLLSARTWIEPDDMAESRPVSYPTRDGKATIQGFLTLPPGTKEPKNLPLIVHPHGGPFDIFDEWGWDEQPQMLASRGYAVLQPNFRGSGGYGPAFHDAGIYGWGTTMIDDISDGVRWAIAQGYVDPKRVCIYGGSYGGYAALMSAVREPDLYRCTVGYAGVYDIGLQERTSDTGQSAWGRAYFREFVARNDQERDAQSPIKLLDRLRAAVLVVHGEDDKRVPIDHARALMRELDRRKYPYETLIKAKEGHGFYSEANRRELYERLLAFFEKNIGAGTVAASADASAAGDTKH